MTSDPITLKTNELSPAARAANSMGINISSASDWSEDRLFANAMQQAREWKKTDDSGSAPSIDKNGWPLEDAGCVVWQGIANMHGTYKLSFTGAADLSISYGRASIANLAYDASKNLTTADLVYENQDGAGLYLTFSNTRNGVKNIKLMRPLRPGATQSYAPTTTFTDPIKQAIAKFSVIRFMDYTATNNNQQVNWSDRVLPTYCSFSRSAPGYGWQGKGGAWEYAIQLCNETGKDAWICVPPRASDDYVRNLAMLWKQGGNGFAGLNANLKLYIEYSNENWNTAGAFQQSIYNRDAAEAEVKAGGSPLNYDGGTNTWHWAWRRVGKRIVEISQIFRTVFGDAAMMSRIRPVLEWQQGDGQNMGTQALTFIENYYNNQAGNFVKNPRPVDYFLWGGGGSAYYNPENESDALTVNNFWSSATMDLGKWYEMQSKDANLAACFGLHRTAYEGGSSLDKCGCPADEVKIAAVKDARMKQAIVDHHNAWSNWGGDLLMYFNSSGDFQWSFTQNIFDLNTPKYQAIDALKPAKRAPLTHGTLVPAAIEGNRWSSVSRGWGGTGSGAVRVDPDGWFSYTIRSNKSAVYSITVQYRSTEDASLRVYCGSQVLGDVAVANTKGETQTSPAFRVSLNANQLYAVRVKAQKGAFDCVQINVG